MKKIIPIIIVIGMLGWAIFEFVSSSSDTEVEDDARLGNSITTQPREESSAEMNLDEIGLEKGEVAPDFEVTTLDGEQAKLSDYQGELVMLNFWATWCPPCRAEMPDMQKINDEEDITILAVNMTETERNKEVVVDFVKEFDLTFPILMDEESAIMESYEIYAYPTSYMIDSNGRIQFINLGAMNYDQMLQQFKRME
ncbi:peroxiredoxin family protein [Amphibacillus sp. Q70]|uniref:peroxiredoxin family protein n=1 Tax=Amphibacillus sp. Q70 TaxID=3453416 RepID=UPI003F858A99